MNKQMQLIETMKLWEQAECYDDMASVADQYVLATDTVISSEFSNLFSDAYKNVVGAKRSAWRVIFSIEAKGVSSEYVDLVRNCRSKMELELQERCRHVLDLVENKILTRLSQDDQESIPFFQKMLGDYSRYMTEVEGTGDERDRLSAQALGYYKQAENAAQHLAYTHPIRLGIMLNLSIYYYEIANLPSKACSIAKKAFDAAIEELDDLQENSYKDSTMIMQLLRDNLTLWTSEQEQDNSAQDSQ